MDRDWIRRQRHAGAGSVGKAGAFRHAACDAKALHREFMTLLSTGGSGFPRLQPPGSTSLAKLVDSEVVAEPIMHDDQMIAVLLAGNKGGEDPGVQSFETQF